MGVFNLFKNMKKKEDGEKQPSSRFIDDEWLEVTASSKEEAIERACVALNTNPSHLEIKTLSKDGRKIRARKSTQEQSRVNEPVEEKKSHSRSSKSMSEEKTDESRDNEQRFDDEEDDNWEDDEEVEEETALGIKARDILSQIVQAIESDAKVELYETTKTIRLEIESKESGLFIGKFGQTLDAIQHLLKKMLELKHEDGKHLIVDAENYRIRREESIETKARKLAKKARQERRPVSIEPMNAMDRRIVHMALKGEPGIETKSVGEGASRRVLIVPKRRGGGPSRGRGDGRGEERYETRGRGGRGRGRGGDRDGNASRSRNPNMRLHDSYDVPAHSKSEVFGDNPEEYFEDAAFDEEK